MLKKIKVDIGDVFLLPVEQNKYCIGVVAKLSKLYCLGYFFKKVFETNLINESNINFKEEDVVIYQILSLRILKDGKWPVIAKGMFKSITNRPMPQFKHYDSLKNENYIIELDSDLKEATRYPSDMSKEEWGKLSESGLAGSIYMEKLMAMLLFK